MLQRAPDCVLLHRRLHAERGWVHQASLLREARIAHSHGAHYGAQDLPLGLAEHLVLDCRGNLPAKRDVRHLLGERTLEPPLAHVLHEGAVDVAAGRAAGGFCGTLTRRLWSHMQSIPVFSLRSTQLSTGSRVACVRARVRKVYLLPRASPYVPVRGHKSRVHCFLEASHTLGHWCLVQKSNLSRLDVASPLALILVFGCNIVLGVVNQGKADLGVQGSLHSLQGSTCTRRLRRLSCYAFYGNMYTYIGPTSAPAAKASASARRRKFTFPLVPGLGWVRVGAEMPA